MLSNCVSTNINSNQYLCKWHIWTNDIHEYQFVEENVIYALWIWCPHTFSKKYRISENVMYHILFFFPILAHLTKPQNTQLFFQSKNYMFTYLSWNFYEQFLFFHKFRKQLLPYNNTSYPLRKKLPSRISSFSEMNTVLSSHLINNLLVMITNTLKFGRA